MQVRITVVNETKGYQIYNEVEDYPWGEYDTTGELFRALRSQYGRCRGHVYVDTDNKTKRVGWTFEKRVKYDDCDETYLQTTWACPVKVIPRKLIAVEV